MCTCITYSNGDFYFGRNLDLDCSFNEMVTVTPRSFPLRFCNAGNLEHHYAMIGMASADKRFPLYAEAVNEKGLAMAGLNFPGSAVYQKSDAKGLELASFEMIAWFLGKCASVEEAKQYLSGLKITDDAFSPAMPPAPLHWMMADKDRCIVIEPEKEGIKVYDNPFGVLTNNPPFGYHQLNMNNYLNLTAESPQNRFAERLELRPFAQGMGAVGLPGDASSVSRFVRAAFLKWNSVAPEEESANITQFFHILDNVAMIRGTVVTDQGTYDITTYSCCVNTRTGIYYYKTYEDSRLHAADMHAARLEGDKLILLSDNFVKRGLSPFDKSVAMPE